MEEIGPAIDWQLHTNSDARGDEGELFSALVRGVDLSEGELQRVKTEDDSAVVSLDGQTLQIEMSDYNLGTLEGIHSYTDSLITGESDSFTFSIANPGGSGDKVAVSTSFIPNLILRLYKGSTLIAEANSNQYPNNSESISLNGKSAGTYTAKVSAIGLFSGPFSYNLTIYEKIFTISINDVIIAHIYD